MGRPAPLLAFLVAAALLVAAVLAPGRSVRSTRPAPAYAVDYVITDTADPEVTTLRKESLVVRRPYHGRLSNSAGRVTNREFSWQLDARGKPRFGFRRAPGGAVRDTSFVALAGAARAGVIVRGGVGAWLGRRCVWFVSSDPPPSQLAPPRTDSRVESCVDPAGIVLREVWTIDARVVRTVEAERVRLTARGTDFLEGEDPEQDEVTDEDIEELLRGQAVVADEVPTPDVPFDLRTPKGWELDRRSVVVEGVVGASRPRQVAASAFVRGSEVTVVEVALRSGDEASWTTGEGDPIDVGLGTGRVLWYPDHVQVRITVQEGFARILAPSLEIARDFVSRLRVRSD